MFGIGLLELIVIFIVILLVVEPEKLPHVARTMSKYISELYKVSDDLKRTIMSIDNDIKLYNTKNIKPVKVLTNHLLKNKNYDFIYDDSNNKSLKKSSNLCLDVNDKQHKK